MSFKLICDFAIETWLLVDLTDLLSSSSLVSDKSNLFTTNILVGSPLLLLTDFILVSDFTGEGSSFSI
jgi:hypothetical protein